MLRRLLILPAAALLSPATASPAAACILPSIFYFAPGSVAFDEDSERTLAGLVSWIQRNGFGLEKILVTGHSDRTGSRSARRAISVARAEAVRDRLVSHGVQARLIEVRGMSDSKTVVATPDGVPELDNRRAEILFKFTEAGLAALRANPPTPIGEVPTC
jgi:outer membrane protein OmpA-like peptidoglycan-associated protein